MEYINFWRNRALYKGTVNKPCNKERYLFPIDDRNLSTKPALEGKGEKNQRCNRSDCQSTKNVIFYNEVMDKYYCPHCAIEIGFNTPALKYSLFPNIHKEMDEMFDTMREVIGVQEWKD